MHRFFFDIGGVLFDHADFVEDSWRTAIASFKCFDEWSALDAAISHTRKVTKGKNNLLRARSLVQELGRTGEPIEPFELALRYQRLFESKILSSPSERSNSLIVPVIKELCQTSEVSLITMGQKETAKTAIRAFLPCLGEICVIGNTSGSRDWEKWKAMRDIQSRSGIDIAYVGDDCSEAPKDFECIQYKFNWRRPSHRNVRALRSAALGLSTSAIR